jgi:hypothetical protein
VIRDTLPALPSPSPSPSPPAPAPPAQAVAAAQAANLVDRIVHERVLACLDLEALHDLEQSLTLTVGTLDEGHAERAAEVASAIVDRALAQLAGDARRYLAALDFMACDGCPLCEDEAEEAPRAAGKATAVLPAQRRRRRCSVLLQ